MKTQLYFCRLCDEHFYGNKRNHMIKKHNSSKFKSAPAHDIIDVVFLDSGVIRVDEAKKEYKKY